MRLAAGVGCVSEEVILPIAVAAPHLGGDGAPDPLLLLLAGVDGDGLLLLIVVVDPWSAAEGAPITPRHSLQSATKTEERFFPVCVCVALCSAPVLYWVPQSLPCPFTWVGSMRVHRSSTSLT